MTLDEAIKHCEEVAERYEKMEDSHDEKLKEECLQCAADHRQLAEWLKELAELKASDVQPVKRGKWETWGYIFKGIEWVRCSRCGKPADVSYFKLLEGKIEPATLSICGCCGADMRQEAGNEEQG